MHLVGHNIRNFDVPYLIRWSMLNQVKVPVYLSHLANKKFGKLPTIWVDTNEFFGASEWGFRVSLNNLSKWTGHEGKNGNGKFFYQLPREEQESYLENDMMQTRNVFRSMNNYLNAYVEERCVFFDIETAPKGDLELQKLAPAFKEEKVKLGNIKDPEKRQAKIEEAREGHFDAIKDKAGLHAQFSDPVAIGYINEGDFGTCLDFAKKDDPNGSKDLVERFWSRASNLHGSMNELNNYTANAEF
jgi:hypothetical protein